MTQPLIGYDATGRPLQGSALADALARGEAGFRRGTEVPMLSPSGEARLVPAEEAFAALQEGYQLHSEQAQRVRQLEREQGFGGAVKQGLAEALSSASLGVSDVIGSGFSPSFAEFRETAKEAFPAATTTGEIAGILGSALIPGGSAIKGAQAASRAGRAAEVLGTGARAVSAPARGVSRLAATLGEGVGARVAGSAPGALRRALATGSRLATEGAIEGATFNVGETISEAALGDHELTAELLLTAAGEGALAGAALGAPLGAGASLARSGARGAVDLAIGTGRRAAAAGDEIAQRALGAGADTLSSKLSQPSLEELANIKAIQAVAGPGALSTDIRKIAEQFGPERLQRIGRRLRDEGILEGVKIKQPQRYQRVKVAAEKAGAEEGAILSRADAVAKPDMGAFIKRMDEYVGELRKDAFGPGNRLADKIEADYISTLRDRLQATAKVARDPATGKIRKKRASEIRPDVTFDELHALRRKLDQDVRRTDFVERKNLAPFRQEFEAGLEDALDAASPELGAAYRAQKQIVQDLIQIRDIAKKQSGKAGDVRSISLSDYISGGIGASLGGVPGAVATTLANRAIREYGDAFVVAAVDRVGALRKLGHQNDQIVKQLARDARDAIMGRAITPPAALRPGPAASAPATAGKLTSPAKATRRTRSPIGTAVKLEQAFADRAQQVREFQADRAQAEQAITARAAPLKDAAPKTSDALTQLQVGDQLYLEQQLPRGQGRNDLLGQFREPPVSPAEKARFLRIARAIDNPLTLLEDFRDGVLSPDAVQAVRERRPKLFRAIQQNLLQALQEAAEEGKVPSYQTRLQLAMLVPEDPGSVDPTFDPAFVQAIQASHAARVAQQAQQQAAPARASEATQRRAERHLTETERIAAGGGT